MSRTISMLPPAVARIVTIVFRVLIVIVLSVSFMMMVTNTADYHDSLTNENGTMHFYDDIGLKYAAAALVIGVVFSIYGIVVMALRIRRGNDEGNLLIDFYGQKVLSNLLVTAAIAGFLAVANFYKIRQDILTQYPNAQYDGFYGYWGKYTTCSGLVILAFIFSLALSILSTHTLARRND